MAHTETPWKLEEREPDLIDGEFGRGSFYRIMGGNLSVAITIGHVADNDADDKDAQRANARLIVRAANSFEAMRDALEAISAGRDELTGEDVTGEDMRYFLIKQYRLWAAARAALKLAEGGE